MSVFTIIGAGMMGSAMSYPLRDNGHEVHIVGTPLDREIVDRLKVDSFHANMKRTLPPGIFYHQIEELEAVIAKTDFFVGGVSSFGVEWFADYVIPRLPEKAVVLSITKGLRETETGIPETFPEYLSRRDTDKNISFNAVGGPCTSYELADRRHTCVTFCGSDYDTLCTLRKAFAVEYYHISCSTDIRGVETAVAMKNVYAAAVSTAIGANELIVGMGGQEKYNPQAGLFGESVREIGRLLKIMGGDPDAIMLAAGDLYVTVFGGRTRKLGVLLGRGKSYAQAKEILAGVTLESVAIAQAMSNSLRKLAAAGKVDLKDFPLLLALDATIHHGADLDIPWEKFILDRP
ncbi:MAG: glycerol-3-phosphate dehydrogenase [Lentisphaerae bacterium]|nr:glycerol-3-phosphate dehydrogenase [Lentisphaerota bacterium]MBR2873544.1 glycerol-3-phosphate dehydrogenase [Lentisphaeria bacterium]